MQIRLDKIASATRNLALTPHCRLTSDIPALAGTVVAVRVLDDKQTYNQLEDVHGRMMTVHRGDIVAGVLGERRALRGYTGVLPERVEVGDTLHLLNLGGVIGLCTSASPEVGVAARVEVLGGVVAPTLGRALPEASWVRPIAASIRPGVVAGSDVIGVVPPAVFLLGSCMSAGKTAAAAAVVRELARAGKRVGVAKVTGVALRRDVLDMLDHGAHVAYTFTDAGLPSTCAEGAAAKAELLRATRGCLNALGTAGVDVAVVEFGDGLLGDYGVRDLLADEGIRAAAGAVVFAATDPVAAFGGAVILEGLGVRVDVVTGPATDNSAGSAAVTAATGCKTANARKEAGLLGQIVLEALATADARTDADTQMTRPLPLEAMA